MIRLILSLLVLGSVLCARVHAQSPRWSYTVGAPSEARETFIEHSVFDGAGGSAWNIDFGTSTSVVWLGVTGRPVYTNTFSSPAYSTTRVRFARFTRTQLAMQVQVEGVGGASTNYLLRVRKVGTRVRTTRIPLGPYEQIRGTVGTSADLRGLFTSEIAYADVIIRRYRL